MRITGLVAMLVIVFVGVTVAVIVVMRAAIAIIVAVLMIVVVGMIVTVAVRMPIAMIVTVRILVVVVAGLASRMVMSAACCSPRLSLLGKQLLHTLFEVGVGFSSDVINYGYRLETCRFQQTQQCDG